MLNFKVISQWNILGTGEDEEEETRAQGNLFNKTELEIDMQEMDDDKD